MAGHHEPTVVQSVWLSTGDGIRLRVNASASSRQRTMNDSPRQKLRELLERYGNVLCQDARRCEALLRDHCTAHRREVFVLVCALREGVAADLLARPPHLPLELLKAQLCKRLHDDLALAETAASWAVEAWAFALG